MSQVIIGNVYDKYNTGNPVARYLMGQFLATVTSSFNAIRPRRVLEVGCGEGHLSTLLLERAEVRPERFVACDLKLEQVVDRERSAIEFKEASIYDLPFDSGSFDLVLCCEVLEHLEEPGRGLAEVARVSGRDAIISTPREPLWRALNLLRGKYIADLGNTPGHVQHFSRRSLLSLVETHFTARQVKSPIPWTVIWGARK